MRCALCRSPSTSSLSIIICSLHFKLETGMQKLITELQRLYFLPGQQWHRQKLDDSGKFAHTMEGELTPAIIAHSLAGETDVALDLVGADSKVRALVINFKRATDWEQVAKLYQAVTNELDLPAPAVSVSGDKGYGLWFSLAEPVAVAQARDFFNALHRKYLADTPVANLEFHPDADIPAASAPTVTKLVPSLQTASGKWSAYIDPSLGAMFIDEQWLEMAPNMDKQASILAGLKCIEAGDFQRVLSQLQTDAETDAKAGLSPTEQTPCLHSEAANPPRPPRSRLSSGKHYDDPESFLLAVMNDPLASPRQRIRAAKALLPYFAKKPAG